MNVIWLFVFSSAAASEVYFCMREELVVRDARRRKAKSNDTRGEVLERAVSACGYESDIGWRNRGRIGLEIAAR